MYWDTVLMAGGLIRVLLTGACSVINLVFADGCLSWNIYIAQLEKSAFDAKCLKQPLYVLLTFHQSVSLSVRLSVSVCLSSCRILHHLGKKSMVK